MVIAFVVVVVVVDVDLKSEILTIVVMDKKPLLG